MKKEKRLVPQLRFQEFKGDGKPSKFGELIESTLYGPRFNAKDYDINGNVKTIRGTDLGSDGEIKYDQVPLALLDAKTIETHKLQDGDLVMITTADCGATGVFRKQEIDFLSSAYGVRIRLNNLGYSNYFKFFFQTWHAKREINKYIRKATVANLPGSDILRIKLNAISLPEQQKIANFLTAIDSRLQSLEKKKRLLEDYKKGVMQRIFKREIRFKIKNETGELVEPPDWEEKKLGKIGITLNGLTGKTKKDFGKGERYIQYKQIFDSSKINISDCGKVHITKNENQTKFQFGDVFFTTSSETPHEIATASVLLEEVIDVYLNSFCFGFRVSTNVLNPVFSQFLFRNENFRRKIIPLAQGSTRYNISKSAFVKLTISVPCLEEQTKIANFLSAIDRKIELVSDQIEKTAVYKKGLLQQLFV